MTLAEILASLFPQASSVVVEGGLIHGEGRRADGSPLHVIGVCERSAVGM